MDKILLNVHGIETSVITGVPEFAQFVRANYHPFKTDAVENPEINVEFSLDAGERAAEIGHSLYGTGMGLAVGNDRLYWENEFGFRVLLTVGNSGNFDILAFHKDLLREQGSEEKYQNFQRSMRWAIHFPIFSLLRASHGWQLMHASAVARNGKAIILCGLNKVGKSTLAMFLHQIQGYELMSDNFLLVGPQKVYAFPEAVRMSRESMDHLNLDTDGRPKIYGKYHVNIENNALNLEAHPKACFLVTRGKELALAKIDASQGWSTLEGMHAILGEFPESSYLALLPFVDAVRFGRHPGPTVLSRDTNWHHLSFPLDWNIKKVIEAVQNCI